MPRLKDILGVALLLGISGSPADTVDAQGGLVAPRAVTQPGPPAPASSAVTPVEGWAIVRYSVLEDGSTSNVRVVDMLPPMVDPAPTIGAVEQWDFAPGTSEGVPIAWHNNESAVAFSHPESAAAPSDAFAERYDSIRLLIEAEAYEEALTASESLLGETASYTELGLALAQRAIAYVGLSDWHSALIPLRQATDPRMPSLPAADLLSALQLRFQVEVQLGRTRDALATYERIDYALDSESANLYQPIADQLAFDWETVEALPVQGRVDDEPWRIAAARRTFTVADVDGMIRGIDIECDLRATRLEFQPNAEWSLPASWGNCELFIDAAPGTTFLYYGFLGRQEEPG